MRNWLIALFLLTTHLIFSQSNSAIKGQIVDEKQYPVPNVQISIYPINYVTTSDSAGFFFIELPSNKSLQISYFHINYYPDGNQIKLSEGEVKQLKITLKKNNIINAAVVIQEKKKNDATKIKINAETAQDIISASDDGISFVKSLASVNSNNELSSSYSVRGGSFDENLIYVNNIQVYRPFLVRAGQQEGLSFVNGDMIKDISFSAGGFDALYGDKLSSVLDITYKSPDSLTGAFSASMLGARTTIGNKHGKLSYIMSGRYKSNSYLLGSLETQGDYRPLFFDYQTYLNFNLNKKWSFGFLGNSSLNQFRMVPQSRTTRFGGIKQALQLTVDFSGQEISRFQTSFGAFTTDFHPFGNDSTILKLTASGFVTEEEETFDIEGSYRLNELETNFAEDDFGKEAALLGNGSFLDHSRNFLNAVIYNIDHTGKNIWKKGVLNWGAKYQHEEIMDELLEWKNQDSAGYSVPYTKDVNLKFADYLKSENKMSTNRVTAFVQNDWKLLEKNGKSQLYIKTGLRANYWDYSNETVISPRASLTYTPSQLKKDTLGNTIKDSTNFSYRLAWGYYYQPPFFRELRNFSGEIATDIKAQKSIHYVAGIDYDFFKWGRPFTLRTEAYYKDMDDIIPFDIENVRIRYYGTNSAKAYAYGLETRINGEFVKGLESWISASYMKTEEDISNDNFYKYYNSNSEQIIHGFTIDQSIHDSIRFTRGYMPRITDQRISVKIFFQDEMLRWKQFKVHLNLIYASGQPFGIPGSVQSRNTERMPDYRRADIGFTYKLVEDGKLYKKSGKAKMPERHSLRNFKDFGVRVEVFNLLDISNTISHLWVSDINNQKYAVPNFLTPRLVNLRITGKF
ncbi:MAG: TonB-dependent receptor [Flavobacteriales bacterium]|nr:TonB-dependent receptor [Flavobacteriales bacterium]|tara:strand:- start:5814 stop:8372 length:2559 start_codon:yes stop_codon:yes gene_type:complete